MENPSEEPPANSSKSADAGSNKDLLERYALGPTVSVVVAGVLVLLAVGGLLGSMLWFQASPGDLLPLDEVEPATPDQRRNTQQCIDLLCVFARMIELPGVGKKQAGTAEAGDSPEAEEYGPENSDGEQDHPESRRLRNASETPLHLLMELFPEVKEKRKVA